MYFIGVDISKNSLDVYIRPEDILLKFSNTEKGIQSFLAVLKNYKERLVVFEATGGYEKPLKMNLMKKQIEHRSAATMVAGIMPPSQLLRKFAAHPRQHDLAIALREVGRIERTLFIIDWLLDTDMQRRAQIGLNKGESHHALKNALRIGRQGEIRDRTTEGQHYRMAGLNLLAAIIIYWNTVHLGISVTQRKIAGLNCSPKLLAHTSPLGWAHILITGEYKWPKQ